VWRDDRVDVGVSGPDRRTPVALAIFAAMIATSAVALYGAEPRSLQGDDIFYAWREGDRILKGENPYSRIHRSNMRDNRKYATYLPGFYLLSAGSQSVVVKDFVRWTQLWRAVFFACYAAIGWLLLREVSRTAPLVLGVLAAAFWLFNRWTVHVLQIVHLEPLAILFLIGSLLLFDRRKRTSYLLLGLSLSIKQIAIFLVPVYLVLEWRAHSSAPEEGSWRSFEPMIRALGWIMLVPIVVSVPFLLWDPAGFVKSMMFSATRNASSHVGVSTFSQVIGWTGLVGRVPMLVMMALLYWVAHRRYLGLRATCFWVLSVFIVFNDVLFRQYFAWAAALLPLALLDSQPLRQLPTDRAASESGPSSA